VNQWDGVDEFVAVANAGSFAAAAKTLEVSNSYLSRAIARFENRIQAQLFFRTTRSVVLTDTGRILVERCRQIIDERDEAFAMIGQREDPQGELRLTCSTALGERYVAPIVRQFAQDFPKLGVTIELSNRLIDLVSEGYDLAVRTGQLSDSRLIVTRIATRRVYVCASPRYLEMAKRPESIEDLAGHKCLIGTSSTWHFSVHGNVRHFRPAGRFRCNSGEAVVEAALADMGICQLPEFYVLQHLKSGQLISILDDLRAEDEPIWAVYPQKRHLLPKVRLLVDRLRQNLGAAVNGGDTLIR
jgi:DNA-binding transcriptional LysR family regulator